MAERSANITPRARRRSRGMTLMEVMVAVAILAMMVAAVWSSFSTTLKGMETTEEVQEHYNGVRNAMDRIAGDVGMAYLSFNRASDETRHFTHFEGRQESLGDTMSFSTFGHLRVRKDADESDQTVVQYYLAAGEDGVTHLWRREDRRLHGDLPKDLYQYAPGYVLLEDVESLEFRYWDIAKDDWTEEWATMQQDGQPDRLPTRVEVKLGVKNNVDEIEYFTTQIPIILQEKIDLSKGG